jgi:hypothetical protein
MSARPQKNVGARLGQRTWTTARAIRMHHLSWHSQLDARLGCGLGTYRRSLSVVILTGVPRRWGLTVSVDFQLSAPELAVDECRSAATSRLVIVDCVLRESGLLLPFETVGGGL